MPWLNVSSNDCFDEFFTIKDFKQMIKENVVLNEYDTLSSNTLIIKDLCNLTINQ